MAAGRVPTGPIEQEPTPYYLPPEHRAQLLAHALAEVELGAWDRRIVRWLLDYTDTSTLVTLASLIERARRVEAATVAADLAGMDRRRPPRAEP